PGVAPLAREIVPPPDDPHAEVPLLLLAPPPRPAADPIPARFAFDLAKPAIDIHTWDRWRAKDQWDADEAAAKGYHDRRVVAWADFYRQAAVAARAGEPDFWLDDPAVEDFFQVRLRRLYPCGDEDLCDTVVIP